MTEHDTGTGLPIDYLPDEDGFRWLTVEDPSRDMAGWRVEVGDDGPWLEFRVMKPDLEYREIRDFRRMAFSGVGERWCAPVNWGELVVRWLPPDSADASS